jgi:Flp pilus assembly protein CpaB
VKRSNRLVILVGVLLAVLAFVGIVVILNSPPGPDENVQSTKVNVIVATQAIEIGEPVTPDKAETLEVEADAVEQTRIADPSLLTGRPALVNISVGEQITQEKAGLGGSPISIENQLQPGEKAIAFQVDRVTGIDFLIRAGDHIDVVLAENVTPVQQTAESIDQQVDNPDAQPRYEVVTGLSNVRTVKTIIQDRRVLYVSATRNLATQSTATPSPGQENQQQATQQIDSVIIVFAGNDQDAELIKFAQQDLSEVGSLTAVLRRITDTDEGVPAEETTGITLKQLIEQYGVVVPDIIVLQPEESPSPAP